MLRRVKTCKNGVPYRTFGLPLPSPVEVLPCLCRFKLSTDETAVCQEHTERTGPKSDKLQDKTVEFNDAASCQHWFWLFDT